jgi:hypothetical protein
MSHTDVSDKPGAKERAFACDSSVDELIDHNEIPGCHFLAERTAGRNRDDIRDTKPFQSINVGAIGHSRGGMHMPAPVAGQKGHGHPIERASQNLVRRRSPRGADGLPVCALEPFNFIKTGSTDHPDHRIHL